jgi:two-component system chemotaxis response regulator CheY
MKRILVVDDAAFMRLSLKTMLEKNGYEVVGEAENGRKAVEMYKIIKKKKEKIYIKNKDIYGQEKKKKIKKFE